MGFVYRVAGRDAGTRSGDDVKGFGMSETFTASNGVGVWINGDGTLETTPAGSEQVHALREFFQAERDKELGRWRWPEKPDYVVHPVSDFVVEVLRETPATALATGPCHQHVSRADAKRFEGEVAKNFYMAARAYFAAHPEPKPWHDAQPGEIWVARISTGPTFDETALHVMDYAVEGVVFMDHDQDERYELTDPAITSARRIWPEPADG